MNPVESFLTKTRESLRNQLYEIVPKDTPYTGELYSQMLNYPLREGKSLRPALAIATCRAFGGEEQDVLPTAAALELFHNAFLIHDDVEDGSERRRNEPTLHRMFGTPTAINVGDAMLAVALEPLLDNMATVGMGRTLAVLDLVVRMVRETAEGQALELSWIRQHTWGLTDIEYVRMVHKKTGWYTFITPVLAGHVLANCGDDRRRWHLGAFASNLGVAFQIQDDLLNLTGESDVIGKENAGDLWEGKRTLILLRALRSATPALRERALAALSARRPGTGLPGDRVRTESDVAVLREAVLTTDALPYAREVARRYATRAARLWTHAARDLPDTVHRRWITAIIDYVTSRVS